MVLTSCCHCPSCADEIRERKASTNSADHSQSQDARISKRSLPVATLSLSLIERTKQNALSTSADHLQSPGRFVATAIFSVADEALADLQSRDVRKHSWSALESFVGKRTRHTAIPRFTPALSSRFARTHSRTWVFLAGSVAEELVVAADDGGLEESERRGVTRNSTLNMPPWLFLCELVSGL